MKTTEQKLKDIAGKHSGLKYNDGNFHIGGGLSDGSFASRRHEDAKYDAGKLTEGQAAQMFKKATGLSTEEVKEVINYAVPNMEWHHAGKLPKSYGGGMKKTYFLNATEIVDIATNWNVLIEKIALANAKKKEEEDLKRSLASRRHAFLQEHANPVMRISQRPSLFVETNREMNGKYGWFCSYGKSYNMPEFYSGWAFENENLLNKYNEIN